MGTVPASRGRGPSSGEPVSRVAFAGGFHAARVVAGGRPCLINQVRQSLAICAQKGRESGGGQARIGSGRRPRNICWTFAAIVERLDLSSCMELTSVAPLLQRQELSSDGPPGSMRSRAAEPKAQNKREEEHMKKLFAAVLSAAVALSLSPAMGTAQTKCPAEVAQAKDVLSKKTASVKPDDIQAPRSLAGARSNENVQSPRGNQDVQSPRGNQNVQSPRGNQNVQSPRGNQDVAATRMSSLRAVTRTCSRLAVTRMSSLRAATRTCSRLAVTRMSNLRVATRTCSRLAVTRTSSPLGATRTCSRRAVTRTSSPLGVIRTCSRRAVIRTSSPLGVIRTCSRLGVIRTCSRLVATRTSSPLGVIRTCSRRAVIRTCSRLVATRTSSRRAVTRMFSLLGRVPGLPLRPRLLVRT